MDFYTNNIHPFNHLLPRESKEKLLGQRARVIWLTGLSGSGKSTIAKSLEEKLHEQGFLVAVLDGDNVRTGINNNLGFSEEDRKENIRRIAEVAKLFLQVGVVTICCFVSPTEEIRNLAKFIIGTDDFLDVFIDTPIEVCESCDVKGLYAKARRGEIRDLTGINAPFEIPLNPSLKVNTNQKKVEENVKEIMDFVLPRVSAS